MAATMGLGRRSLHYFKDLRAEAIMLCYALGNLLPAIFLPHFVVATVCKRDFPQFNCSLPFDNSTVDIELQASNWLLWMSVIRTVPSLFYLVFLGPWCDQHRRSIPTLAPMAGKTLTWVIFGWVDRLALPKYVLLLAEIPSGLTGGDFMFKTGFYGWVKDAHSTPESMVRKMSVVIWVETLITVIAPFVGSRLIVRFGFSALFAVSCVLMLIAGLLVYFLVDDDRPSNFKTVIEDMLHRKTLHIDFLLFNALPIALSFYGHQEILDLLFRLGADFSTSTLSLYSKVQGLTNTLGFVIVAPILVLLDTSQTAVAIVSSIAFMAYCYWICAISKSMITLFALGTLQLSVVISLLADKSVTKVEIEKAKSPVKLSRAIHPILSVLIVILVGKHTSHQMPWALFHITAVYILFTIIAIVGYHYLATKRNEKRKNQ